MTAPVSSHHRRLAVLLLLLLVVEMRLLRTVLPMPPAHYTIACIAIAMAAVAVIPPHQLGMGATMRTGAVPLKRPPWPAAADAAASATTAANAASPL
jgi:hypothetical protein